LLVLCLALSNLSIFYGFWAWVRLKGKNEWWILWAFLSLIGVLVLAFSENETAKSKSKKKVIAKLNPWLHGFNIATLIIIVFLGVFWPSYYEAKGVATQATFAPSDGWEEALHWLKDNTPEPLGIDGYYNLYDNSFVYPDSAYGVTAWWDYGYWITRTAHRMPSANPSQSPEPIKKVANLFLSEDQQQARDIMKALDSSYIILENSITDALNGKLWAVATWAGKDQSAYADIYYYRTKDPTTNQDTYTPIGLFSPEYYRLLSVRLYNFDGKASTSESPLVITYDIKTDSSGRSYRVISQDPKTFDTYLSAQNYIKNQQNPNMVIVGISPFINPVPIEAVTDYNLIFSSKAVTTSRDGTAVPEVKIFQYLVK
jgi:asparagine N-glycosylation enzyme membrane subunit Stt3